MPISRQLQSTAAVLLIAAGAAACSSPRANVPPPSAVESLSPAPSGRVTSEPLAPPPGAQAAIDPLPPEPEAAPPDVPPGAGAEPPPVTPRVTASGRSSVVGGWTATDAKGSCRIALSSSPALDLYKASATNCASPELGKVSAWDYRDGEVFLYQPGGTVTARLKQAGASLDGQLARSGAPLSMIR